MMSNERERELAQARRERDEALRDCGHWETDYREVQATLAQARRAAEAAVQTAKDNWHGWMTCQGERDRLAEALRKVRQWLLDQGYNEMDVDALLTPPFTPEEAAS